VAVKCAADAQNVTCSGRGHVVAVDVFEDDVYWVTTSDHEDHDAAVLRVNKFARSVHSAGDDVVTLLTDLRAEIIIAHPALQMPGQTLRTSLRA